MNLVRPDEASILVRYLLKQRVVPGKVGILYEKAIKSRSPLPGGRSEKIFRFALKKQWSMGALDGALAFSKGQSLLRQRLLIMTAILETQPEYAELFLPQRRNWFYNIYIFRVGCRAVLKMIMGKFILAFI